MVVEDGCVKQCWQGVQKKPGGSKYGVKRSKLTLQPKSRMKQVFANDTQSPVVGKVFHGSVKCVGANARHCIRQPLDTAGIELKVLQYGSGTRDGQEEKGEKRKTLNNDGSIHRTQEATDGKEEELHDWDVCRDEGQQLDRLHWQLPPHEEVAGPSQETSSHDAFGVPYGRWNGAVDR